jgi:endonuclease-3
MKDLQKRKEIFKKINKVLKKLYPEAKIALNFSNPWELLVAVILSAQTTDKKVNEITEKLFKKYKTLDDYVKANLREFEKDIKGVNYYKNKAKFILENAKIIKEKFNGQVPKTMEELLTLKGVARKTANIVLSVAYNIYEGIAVDTHVKRLSKLLGLTNETKPEKIEKDLMMIIPKGLEWRDFPLRLIQYGREYCPAKKHNHQNCPLTKVLKNNES